MGVGRTGLWISALTIAFLHMPAQQPVARPPVQPPAAAPDSAESLPTIHVTSRIVELDVVVSDGRGNVARGLTASDFHLTEDGVPQHIDSFTEHDAASPGSPVSAPPQLPPNTFTVEPAVTGNGAATVIVVNSSFRWNPFFRDQLRDYFQTADLTAPAAIFRLDGQGMHLIQGFTTNRERLIEAATSRRIWPVLGPAFAQDPPSFRVRALGTPTQRLAAYLAGIPGRINVVWIGGVAPANQFDQAFPDQSTSLTDVASMVDSLNRTTDVRRLSRIALYSIVIGACGLGTPSTSQPKLFAPFPVSGEITQADMEPQVNSVADADRVFANYALHETGASTGGRDFWCTFPKQALQQIAATGTHYYTISYRPTNPNWNGAYRYIHLDVTDYAQPPLTLRWYQLLTGWANDVEPTVMYRQGYFARSTSPGRDTPVGLGAAAPAATTPATPDSSGTSAPASSQRRLISISPKGAFTGNFSAQIVAAMAFGSLTPADLPFTIVVTPEPDKEKTKSHDHLPTGNFLTAPFRDGPYRNYHIHYWIDPQNLRFVRNPSGLYHEDLKTIAAVYRDDSVVANSLATTTHLDLTADQVESVLASGITLDQTIAIPTIEHFFLRAIVSEDSTKRVGALEIPIEWIKLTPQPQLAAKPTP